MESWEKRIKQHNLEKALSVELSTRMDEILKSYESDIEKGKKANVGEIREWAGKRYRKQANGEWLEVSEHGVTKKEHEKKEFEKYEQGDRVAFTFDDKNLSGTISKIVHTDSGSVRYRIKDNKGNEYSVGEKDIANSPTKLENMSDSERKEYLKISSKELSDRMQSYLDKKHENK